MHLQRAINVRYCKWLKQKATHEAGMASQAVFGAKRHGPFLEAGQSRHFDQSSIHRH